MNDLRIEELRDFATDFVSAEPGRSGCKGFWEKPLLVSAPIDERFEMLPQIPGRLPAENRTAMR